MIKTQSDTLDKLIDASVASLGLPVEPEWKPGIKANLQVTLHLAAMVAEFELPTRRSRPPCSRRDGHGYLGIGDRDRSRRCRRQARPPSRWWRRRCARIAERDRTLNAFTAVTAERALAKGARRRCSSRARQNPGPLAGVPFAVKNLFDVAGLPTLAGSKINRDRPPASADATLIARLEAAGAILVGALNMGEYAYDFTGENMHDGPSRNPHEHAHMTGGSSGGSGGAVAGGLVPIALGSDTNGSIRVPSSFCGLFGLKPTYGRLSRARTFPFVASLDHVGPLARSTRDLALAYDAMQGPDAEDPVCAGRPVEPALPASVTASAACASRLPAAISSAAPRRRRSPP